ncbi:hypothetical protein COOONC_23662 [Cooperia oncophora]
MHHEEVIRWAKDCAKRIPYDGSVSLYAHLYPDNIDDDGESVDEVFSRDEYRKFLLVDITPLSHDTNLYRFEIPKGKVNLPIGCHLRTRYDFHF